MMRRVTMGAIAQVLMIGAAGVACVSASAAPPPGLPPNAIVAAPPPASAQVAQAAADRPDRFVAPRGSALRSHASSPTLPGGAWQPLGPAPLGTTGLQGPFSGIPNAGRVTSAVEITSGTLNGRIIVGSASGGIWTSDNGGTTWTPRTDQAATLGIGALAIDPTNPMHVIAGTGEDNHCGDCAWGQGILSSTDGGTTWTLQDPGGIFDGLKVAQVAIDPNAPTDMFAATSGGLFVTADGGMTWATPTDASYASLLPGRVTAVVINPSTNPSTVFVAGTDTGQNAVRVAESTSPATGTWTAASSGIEANVPTAGQQDVYVALAIAPSNHQVMYASVGDLHDPVALYTTSNGGTSWSPVTVPDYTSFEYAYNCGCSGEQGWYDNVLAVDPANRNHVLAGGTALVETTDGGGSWVNTNGGFFGAGPGNDPDHPDHHALFFLANGKALIGDDGGIYLYTPGTAGTPPTAGTFTNLNGNLDTIQFYFGFGEVGGTLLAGSQDNSSAQTSSPVLSGWAEVAGGDGSSSLITPNDPSVRFIQQDGEPYVTTDAFQSTLTDMTPRAGNSIFSPPMALIPNTTTPAQPTVFYGGDGVYRTTDPTTAPPTWTHPTSSGGDLVTSFGVSPSNPNVIYAGYNSGVIQVSTDGGATWNPLATQPFTPDTWITGISVDPSNPDAITASVSVSDTRSSPGLPHVAQYVWTGSPSSGTWTVITGNLPALATTGPTGATGPLDTGAVSHVVYDDGTLIAATDQGVYGTTAANGNSTLWSPIATGLPNVQVQDLYVDPTTGALYAVTHGRGAWALPAAPVVSSITPSAGPVAGGTSVTITGTALSLATSVTFGSTAVTGAAIRNNTDTSLTVTAPPGTAGGAGVTVTTDAGALTSQTSPSDVFTYDPVPTVSSVAASAGPVAGGGTVTITGSGFVAGATVNFGGTAATNVTVASPTQITATVPAGSAGTVDVTVTTPGGTSTKTSADQFTYDPVPAVTAVSPATGSTAGGTAVTVTGTGFVPGTTVRVGSSAATTVQVSSATQLTATTPAGLVGTVDITVTTPGGSSMTSASDQFTYTAPPVVPAVTAVSPSAGPLAGGRTERISGSGFANGAVVKFGGVTATGVTVASATQLTATAPARPAGTVDVTVTTAGGTSAVSASDRFTYDPAPAITKLSVTHGKSRGGAKVTITGSGFVAGAAVSFGGSAAKLLSLTSTQAVVKVPKHKHGKVTVTITTPGGTSAASRKSRFTYRH